MIDTPRWWVPGSEDENELTEEEKERNYIKWLEVFGPEEELPFEERGKER